MNTLERNAMQSENLDMGAQVARTIVKINDPNRAVRAWYIEPETTELQDEAQSTQGLVIIKRYTEAKLSDGSIAGILVEDDPLDENTVEACYVTPHFTIVYESYRSRLAKAFNNIRGSLSPEPKMAEILEQ